MNANTVNNLVTGSTMVQNIGNVDNNMMGNNMMGMGNNMMNNNMGMNRR
jgi:hypothetical protein